MSKITEAEDIPASSVECVKEDMGIFKVQGGPTTCYMVNFGLTTGVTPSCECLPWMKSRLLCKHFFAVFRHCPNWGFDKISSHYTNQAHITLDEHVVTVARNNGASEDCPLTPASTTFKEENDNTLPSPNPCTSPTPSETSPATDVLKPTQLIQSSLNTIARQCRETLLDAKNLTYLIHDPEILRAFNTSLSEAVTVMKSKIPVDHGLLLEKQKTAKEMRMAKLRLKKKRDSSSHHLSNLPKQEKKTHPYSQRVGAKAEMMKKMFQVKLYTGTLKLMARDH